MKLTWDPPFYDGGSQLTSYQIVSAPGRDAVRYRGGRPPVLALVGRRAAAAITRP